MFGSVSELITQAIKPPYKIVVGTRQVTHNELAMAVHSIIEMQRDLVGASDLEVVHPTGVAPNDTQYTESRDGTFRSDEIRSARDRTRVTEQRSRVQMASQISQDELGVHDNARDFAAYLASRRTAAPDYSTPIAPQPSGVENPIPVDVGSYERCKEILDIMFTAVSNGRNVMQDEILVFTTYIRRAWNRVSWRHARGIVTRIQRLLSVSNVDSMIGGSCCNILRRWMVTVCINMIVNEPHAIVRLRNLEHMYEQEITHWQAMEPRRHNALGRIQTAKHSVMRSHNLLRGVIEGRDVEPTRELASAIINNRYMQSLEGFVTAYITEPSSHRTRENAIATVISALLFIYMPYQYIDEQSRSIYGGCALQFDADINPDVVAMFIMLVQNMSSIHREIVFEDMSGSRAIVGVDTSNVGIIRQALSNAVINGNLPELYSVVANTYI